MHTVFRDRVALGMGRISSEIGREFWVREREKTVFVKTSAVGNPEGP